MFARPRSLFLFLFLFLLLSLVGCAGEPGGRCGSGSWQPGSLELHHLAVGQADATLIVAPDGQSMLVDAGESHPDSVEGARRVGAAVQDVLGCRRLDVVLITHFHLDHVGAVGVGGLWHLVQRQGFRVGRLIHRDFQRFVGEGALTLASWRTWLAGPGVHHFPDRQVAVAGLPIDLGPRLQVRVVAADGAAALLPGAAGNAGAGASAPPSENDYSLALLLRFGALDYFLGGDLSGEHLVRGSVSYHDIESVVARGLTDVDIYRVNHHGSEHSSNPTFLGQIDPQVAIISAGRGNPHGHPHPRTLDRLLATGAVYLTEPGLPAGGRAGADRGGGVVVRSRDGQHFTVDGQPFLADDTPRIDRDGDGYFREVDPDDSRADRGPAPFGGCDPVFQRC